MTVQSGATLSHYRLLEKIGEGGMGVVWRALDMTLGREVALKILPDEVTADTDGIARFEREARILAALNHPNVVTIHSIECEQGCRFLTMELVRGRSLSEVISRGGLSLEKFFEIAIPLSVALSAAHEKGIIHRDLKPANIMLTAEGEVKVLDFGLAKLKPAPTQAQASECSTQVLTSAGQIVGTFPYMSPEQIQGKQVDHRSDIFSLGVILHEMATGSRPFQGNTVGELASSILRDAPAAVTELRPELPGLLSRLVRRCLEKEPTRRYQSALDVRNELEDLRKETGSESELKLPLRTQVGKGFWQGRGLMIAALLLLLAAGLITVLIVFGPSPFRTWFARGVSLQARSIAVLPLGNLMGDPAQDFFVDGMHDALITELAKTGLKVISRTTVVRYKRTDKTAKQIAGELGVDALVEGTVLRIGNKVRINAQLINGTTDEHVWTDSYDRDLANALGVLTEVTRAIASQIKLTLTQQQKQRLVATRPVNPEAQDAYFQGRYLVNQANAESARESISFFEKAIEADPNFAPAYSGLAMAQSMVAILSGSLGDPERQRARRHLANKALDLDPGLADAHAVAGMISLYGEWDWEHAEKELKLAIELNPSDAWVYHPYADCLLVKGRFDESVEVVRKGAELDPLSPTVVFPIGPHLVFARHFDQAIEEEHRTEVVFPGNQLGRNYLMMALWHKGQYREALAEYRNFWQHDAELVQALDRGLSRGGPRAGMRAVAQLLDTRSQSTRVNPLDVARFYALADDPDRAMEWLEHAYQQRVPFLAHLRADPDYDSLRSDPRFQDLLRRMHFPQ